MSGLADPLSVDAVVEGALAKLRRQLFERGITGEQMPVKHADVVPLTYPLALRRCSLLFRCLLAWHACCMVVLL
jgi:hypothetical protein